MNVFIRRVLINLCCYCRRFFSHDTGGGHLNHTLFWGNLTPEETAPGPETTKAIAETFGGLDALKADMSAKTVAVQVCKSGMKDICFLLLFLVLTLYFFQNVGLRLGLVRLQCGDETCRSCQLRQPGSSEGDDGACSFAWN